MPRKLNPKFMQPLTPSTELSQIVGTSPCARTQIVKKMWVYIKENKLQDKKERTMINADDKLKIVFGGKSQVNMFEMNRLLKHHLKVAV